MKKIMKKLTSLVVTSSVLLSLTGCASATMTPSNEATPENPVVIRVASSSPSNEFEGEGKTALAVTLNYFMREIEERTDGRIVCEFYPDGQLASSTEEHIGGLQNGAFDMISLNNGSWASYTSAFAGLNTPYLFANYDEAHAVLDSEIGESWKQKAQEDTRVIPLGFSDIGFRQLTNSIQEITSPEDLEGVKIRVMPDNIQTATWQALGAAVTPVSYSELYTALQQKMVDGQENPVSNIVSSKVYELQPYMTITNHNYTVSIAAMSPVIWSRFTDEDKALIQEVMIEAQEAGREKSLEVDESFLQIIKDSGVQVTELTPDELKAFQDSVIPVWDLVKEDMGEEAFNELVEFLDNYEE